MAVCAYNIELKPTEQLFNHWRNILSEAAHAFGECTNFIVSNKVPLSVKTVHDNVYSWMCEKHPSLPAQTVIKVYKDAIGSLKSIRSNKHKNTSIPVKRGLSLHLDKRLYGRLSAEGITLSNGNERMREIVPLALYPKAEEMFLRYTFYEPSIFFRDGRMFLSVPFEVPDKPLRSQTLCGVDLGVRQMFVTSEGKSFTDKVYLSNKRKIRYKKRLLQSNGSKSARRRLRKLRRREHNLTKDMCFRAVRKLIASTDAGVLAIEDLRGIKRNTSRTNDGHKRKKHNNRTAQVPFHSFKEILLHKAPSEGKRVETVSPTYTSQTDSRTGKRDGVRRGRRYLCKDGIVLDADWNAAVNIALRSNHPLSSEQVPVDGGLTLLGGRPLSTGRLLCKPSERLTSVKGLASHIL